MVSEITRWFSRASLSPQFPIVSTLIITALAAVLRFINLASPSTLVFDETYYAKDAYTLGQFGSERVWPEDANASFEAGNPDVFTDVASYVVHPPLGKWVIWLGIYLFGAESSFGWRFSTALLGTLAVPLLILIARKLTKSHGFASIAGLLLALEGQSIVLSRTAILDGILTFFVLVSTWFLLKALEYQRNRLAKQKVRLHLSPWILLLGIGLGLASSVKWSGIFFLAAYGLVTFIFDWQFRARAGQSKLGAIAQGFVNAVTISLATLGTYLVSWMGWFVDEKAWGKDKVENPLFALISYHQQILSFHTGLDKDHPYQSSALQWLVNARPTAFYFENLEGGPCWIFEECAVAITAMPNLVVWFGGLFSMLWIFRNRLRTSAGLIVAVGFLAAWLPWVFFPERTIFQFYAVLISPFFIMALVLALQHYWRRGSLLRLQRVREKRIGYLLLAAIVTAALYLSLWLGLPVPTIWWRLQLFLPFWI